MASKDFKVKPIKESKAYNECIQKRAILVASPNDWDAYDAYEKCRKRTLQAIVDDLSVALDIQNKAGNELNQLRRRAAPEQEIMKAQETLTKATETMNVATENVAIMGADCGEMAEPATPRVKTEEPSTSERSSAARLPSEFITPPKFSGGKELIIDWIADIDMIASLSRWTDETKVGAAIRSLDGEAKK